MSEQAQQQIPWRDLLTMAYRRRKIIVAVLVVGSTLAVLNALTLGPSYTATATLIITANRARVTVSPDAGTGTTLDRITDEDLNSEVALLKSRSLIREVLEGHQTKPDEGKPDAFTRVWRIATLPLRLPGILYRRVYDIAPMSDLDDWVEYAEATLSVTPVRQSNLIRLSFTSGRPKWAANFLNELIAHHIDRHTKLSKQSEALHFFESQRQLLAERSREAERELQAFYEREGIESVPEQRTLLRTRLGELETSRSSSTTELSEGKARIAFIESELAGKPRQIATESKTAESGSQVIKPRILELELQRSELLSKYAPTSVKIKDIDRQIEEAKRLLRSGKDTIAETTAVNPAYQQLEVDLATTRAQMAAVDARVATLDAQIGELRGRLAHLDEISTEQARLEQDLASAKEAYITYAKKEEAARFTSALDQSTIVNIAVAEPAEVPTVPAPSKIPRSIAFGVMMSLAASLAIAFVVDKLDPSVKSASEAQGVSHLPVIAEISS